MRMRSLVAFLSLALIVTLCPVPDYAAQQPSVAPTADQISNGKILTENEYRKERNELIGNKEDGTGLAVGDGLFDPRTEYSYMF